MAYPYICKPCLTENHDDCEETENTPPAGSFICGGGFCVCRHGGEESAFEESVRKHYVN